MSLGCHNCPAPSQLAVSNSNSRAYNRVRSPLPGLNRPRATGSSEPARCHSNRKQPAATSSVTHIRSDSPATGDWPPATMAGNSDCPSDEDTAISAATGRAACPARSRPATPSPTGRAGDRRRNRRQHGQDRGERQGAALGIILEVPLDQVGRNKHRGKAGRDGHDPDRRQPIEYRPEAVHRHENQR